MATTARRTDTVPSRNCTDMYGASHQGQPVFDLFLAGHSHGGASHVLHEAPLVNRPREVEIQRRAEMIGLLGPADADLVDMKLCRKHRYRGGL